MGAGLADILASVECVMVRTPVDLGIDDYRRRMAELVLG